MLSLPRFRKCFKGCELPSGYRARHVPVGEKIEVLDWNTRVSSFYIPPRMMTREMTFTTARFYEKFQEEREALKDLEGRKPRNDFFKLPSKPGERIEKKVSKKYVPYAHPGFPKTFGRTGYDEIAAKNLQGRYDTGPDLRYVQS